MISREELKAKIERLPEKHLEEVDALLKRLTEERSEEKLSFMKRLSQIKIEGLPPDASQTIDDYLYGNKKL